jgi:ABC-type sugar transport system ATPase subunit
MPSSPSNGPVPLPAEASPVALRVTGLAKAFGPTVALRSCSAEFRAGEVHAVMGENGSGKSTLVKILTGVHRPDAGTLELAGADGQLVTVPALRNPGAASRAGIMAVFQEVLVVDSRSVLENAWLGADTVFRAKLPEAVRQARASAVFAELLGGDIDLDAPAGSLPLSKRQACAIARVLLREPRLLILDEATSALDVATRDRLFEVIGARRASGMSTLFISHRMDEISEIADRVTVLRSGESKGTLERAEATPERLVRLMTGADHLAGGKGAHQRLERAASERSVLTVHDLRLRPDAAPVSLDLRAGEVIGLAGLEGHGQDEFLRALWEGDAAGRVLRVDGDAATPVRSARQAAALGIGYVPRDRRRESLFPPLSIGENFGAVTSRADRRLGLLSHTARRGRLAQYTDRLGIRMGRSTDLITTLSGGNQQKVIIARWLASEPRILLLNDPTRGIDLGAKQDIYTLLDKLAVDGVAVVMLSTEVDEHVELMDRVLVFREGTVGAVLHRDRLSRAALVSAFFGQEVPR